ncbi:MAG: PAS domain S-box protein, partial [Deltaproteobacteria bacterium]|nr:PAS domain S-box protein [Deltaproteobacteria bacterium]
MPKTSQDNTNKLQPDQRTRAYSMAKQGSWVRVGATLFIWIFAFSAYAFSILKNKHISGITICVLILIAINIPYILILRKTESRRVYEFMSILNNLLEVFGYTAIIYFLGGLRALYLTPIYAVLITYLGIIAPPRFPFVVAAFSAGSLSTVVALEYYGFIPSMDLYATPPLPGPDQGAIVLVVSITLFVIAFLTSSMVSQLRKNKEKLQEQYAELEAKAEEIELTDRELRKTQQELENRVEERTAELKEAVDRLKDEIRERQQAEEALRESEARFRHIVESSPLPMGIVNKDAIIEYVNPKFIETFGYMLEDVPRLADWFHLSNTYPTYPLSLIKNWQATMEKTDPVIFSDKGLEVDLTCKDGSVRA